MSDVEKFYAALCAKWPNPMPPWNELDPGKQQHFIAGINAILGVMS
jgi:hypothetical protein